MPFNPKTLNLTKANEVLTTPIELSPSQPIPTTIMDRAVAMQNIALHNENLSPLESSELIEQAVQYNYGKATRSQRREEQLRNASKRAKERLTGEQEYRDKQVSDNLRISGASEEQVQAYLEKNKSLRNMPDEERILYNERAKQGLEAPDKELQALIDNPDTNFVESVLADNPKLLQYVMSKKEQRMGNSLTLLGRDITHSIDSSIFSPSNLGSNILSGLAETTMAVEGATAMATKSGKERLDAMQNMKITDALNKTSDELSNNAKVLSELKGQATEDIGEDVYTKQLIESLNKSKSLNKARTDANLAQLSFKVQSLMSNKMQITSEITEMIPDILMTMGTGGISFLLKKGGVKLLTREVEKTIQKRLANAGSKAYENSLVRGATQTEAQIAKNKAESVVKERTKDLFEKSTKEAEERIGKLDKVITPTVLGIQQFAMTGAQNAPQSYKEASDTVLAMSAEDLMKTPAGQQLKQKYPNKTSKEIQQLLADEAGAKGYNSSFWVNGLLGLAGMGAELKLNKIVWDKNIKDSAKNLAISTATNTAQEFGEEYSSVKLGRSAVNNVLGTNIDEEKGALSAGIQGAFSGGGSTASIHSTALAEVGINKALNFTAKKIEKSNEKTKEKILQNEEVDFMSKMTGNVAPEPEKKEQTLKEKIFGSNKQDTINKEFSDKVRKDFANTNVGKQILKTSKDVIDFYKNTDGTDTEQSKVLAQEFNDNPSILEISNIINNLATKANKDIDTLSNKSNLTEEEQNRLEAAKGILKYQDTYLKSIRESFAKDLDTIHNPETTEGLSLSAITDFINSAEGINKKLSEDFANNSEQLKSNINQVNTAKQHLENIINNLTGNNQVSAIINSKSILEQQEDEVLAKAFKDKDIVIDIPTRKEIDTLGSASINRVRDQVKTQIETIDSNKDLTPKQRKIAKRKIAIDFAKAVKQIVTKDGVNNTNVTDKWNSIRDVTDNLLSTLEDDSLGLEANDKNILYNAIARINELSNNIANNPNKFSTSEQITMYGKYIGTSNGGYKNRGNIGILGYVQSALNNKGKLNTLDEALLRHFDLTQKQKALALTKLLQESIKNNVFDSDGNVIGEPLVIENNSLKTSKQQMNQDRTGLTTFRSKGELLAYIRTINNDKSMFDELSSNILTTTKYKSKKINGSGITRNTENINTNNINNHSKANKKNEQSSATNIGSTQEDNIYYPDIEEINIADDINRILEESNIQANAEAFDDSFIIIPSNNSISNTNNDNNPSVSQWGDTDILQNINISDEDINQVIIDNSINNSKALERLNINRKGKHPELDMKTFTEQYKRANRIEYYEQAYNIARKFAPILKKAGYHVKFKFDGSLANFGAFNPDTGTISINPTLDGKTQLHTLLHEMGHLGSQKLRNLIGYDKYAAITEKLATNPFIAQMLDTRLSNQYKNAYKVHTDTHPTLPQSLVIEEILVEMYSASLTNDWSGFAERYEVSEKNIPIEFKTNKPKSLLHSFITALRNLLNATIFSKNKLATNEDIVSYVQSLDTFVKDTSLRIKPKESLADRVLMRDDNLSEETEKFIIDFKFKIDTHIDFTNQQWNLLAQANKHLDVQEKLPSNKKEPLVVSGYAGTGKTTVIDYLFQYRSASGKNNVPVYLAPTWAAVGQLAQKTNSASTTVASSVIGSNGDFAPSGVTDEILERNVNDYIEANKLTGSPKPVIVVDEASFITEELVDKLNTAFHNAGYSIIYMGDEAQLPPIDERDKDIVASPVFSYPNKITLTEVKRAKDPYVLKAQIAIRNRNEIDRGKVPVYKENTENLAFFSQNDGRFMDLVKKYFTEHPNDTVYLASTNEDVRKANNAIRRHLRGLTENDPNPSLTVGDSILGYIGFGGKKPIHRSDNKEPTGDITTSIKYRIENILNGKQGEYGVYKKDGHTLKGQKLVLSTNDLLASEANGRITGYYVPLFEQSHSNFPIKGITDNPEVLKQNREYIIEVLNSNLKSYFTDLLYANTITDSNKKKEALETANTSISGLRQWLANINLDQNAEFEYKFVPNTLGHSTDELKYRDYSDFVPVIPEITGLKWTLAPSKVKSFTASNIFGKGYSKLNDKEKTGLGIIGRLFSFTPNKGFDAEYASTINKAQGSTYKYVFADLVNLPPNLPIYSTKNKMKIVGNNRDSSIYVAMSRASEQLIVRYDSNNVQYLELPNKDVFSESNANQQADSKTQNIQSNNNFNTDVSYEMMQMSNSIELITNNNNEPVQQKSITGYGLLDKLFPEGIEDIQEINRSIQTIQSTVANELHFNNDKTSSKPISLPPLFVKSALNVMVRSGSFTNNDYTASEVFEVLMNNPNIFIEIDNINQNLKAVYKAGTIYSKDKNRVVLGAVLAHISSALQIFKNESNNTSENKLNSVVEEGYYTARDGNRVKKFGYNEKVSKIVGDLKAKITDILNGNEPVNKTIVKEFTVESFKDKIIKNKWLDTTGSFLQNVYNDKYSIYYRLWGVDVLNNDKVANPLFDEKLTTIKKSKSISMGELFNFEQLASTYDFALDNSNEEFLVNYRELASHIGKTLQEQSVPLVENSNTSNISFYLNGLVNLLNIDKDNRRVEIPATLNTAITDSIIKATQNMHGTLSPSRVRDEYSDEGKFDLVIVDVTKSTDSGHKTIEKLKAKEKLELVDTDIEENLASLGTLKDKFIEDLGKNILDNLGIKFNEEHPNYTVAKGMQMSVGLEAYNIMLGADLLKVQRLIKVSPTQELENQDIKVFIDHINFAWNTTGYLENNNYEQAYKYLKFYKAFMVKDNALTNDPEYTKFVDNLKPMARALSKTLSTLGSEAGTKLFPENVKNLKGYSTEKPFEVSDKDVENITTSGKNTMFKKFIQAHNDIEWNLNIDLYESLENAEDLIKSILGYKSIENAETNTKQFNKSQLSKNSQIDRSISIIREVTKGDKNWKGYIKHKAISTQRIGVDSSLHYQGDKFIRELIVPSLKTKDGKPFEFGFDSKGINSINLVQLFKDTLNNPDKFIDDVLEFDTRIGYARALAQAFGIKVENLLNQEVIEKLDNILSQDDFQKLITEVAKTIKGKEKVDINTALKLANKYGIDSMRAYNAVFTLAQLNIGSSLNSKGQFQPMLMIELDGRGNGVMNNGKQFSTRLSSNYLQLLKRTGSLQLDNIVQIANQKGIDVSKLEGAAEIFRTNPFNSEDTISDVYQTVSDEFAKQLTKTFKGKHNYLMDAVSTVVKAFNEVSNVKFDIDIVTINDFIRGNNIFKTVQEKIIKDATENEPFNYESKEFSQYQMLHDYVQTIGMLSILDGFKNKELTSLLFSTPLSQFDKLDFAIERAIAKLAVTPANYGGQIAGISNQVYNDFKKNLFAEANRLYKTIQDSDTLTSGLQDEFFQFYALTRVFGVTSIVDNKLYQIDSRKAVLNYLNDFATLNSFTKNNLIRNVTRNLGVKLNQAITTVYGEQFNNVHAIINLDNAMYIAFINELNDKLLNALVERNRKHGYIDINGKVVDPRAFDFLTKKEIRNVLKNLRTLPNIGTAMSEDNKIVDTLFHTGNSIIKESRKRDLKTSTNLNTMYTNLTTRLTTNSSIKSTWISYDPAGASALTSSIVSTEGRTMGEFTLALADYDYNGTKLSTGMNQVFDGAEIFPFMYRSASQTLNKITDEIHSKISLIESFFHKFNRSSLKENLEQLNMKYIEEVYKRFTTKRELFLSTNLLTAIQTVSSSLLYELQFKSNLSQDEVKLKVGLTSFRNLLTSLQEQLLTFEFDGTSNSLDINKFHKVDLKMDLNQEAVLGYVLSIIKNGNGTRLLQKVTEDFATKVASHAGIKAVESKILPSIVEQFGGSGSGYIKNQDKVSGASSRFIEFLNTNGIDINTLATRRSSEVLLDFLLQDKETLKVFTEAKNKKLKQLNIQIDKPSAEINIKSLDDLSVLLDKAGKDVVTKTAKAMKDSIITQLKYNESIGLNTAIHTNVDSYLDKSDISFELENTIRSENVNAYYHPKLGILIKNSYDVTGLIHELKHAQFNLFFDSYYAEQAQGKQTTSLTNNSRSALNLLERIARDFSAKAVNDTRTINALKQLRDLGKEFNINHTYGSFDKVTASVANVLWVFSKEFEQLMDDDKTNLAKAKSHAMKEFYAYAHSEQDFMNQLEYRGLTNRKAQLEDSGFRQVWNTMKKTLSNFVNTVASVFGLTSEDVNKDKSYLADSLRAMAVLGNITSTEDSSLQTNTKVSTQLGMNVYGLSEDFIEEKGSASILEKQNQEAFKNQIREANISDKHKRHLDMLFELSSTALDLLTSDKVHNNVETYSQEFELIKQSDTSVEALDNLAKFRTLGLTFSEPEEEMYKLQYAINKANLTGRNDILTTETVKLVDDIASIAQNLDFFKSHQGLYEAMFNNSKGEYDHIANVIALVSSNEEVKDSIDQALNKTKSNKFNNFINNHILFRDSIKALNQIKDKSHLEQVVLANSLFKFNSRMSSIEQLKHTQEKLNIAQAKLKMRQRLDEVSELVPNKFLSKALYGSAIIYFSGLDLEKDTDTTLGKAIQTWVDNQSYLKGKPTLASKLLRLFRGAYSDVQHIYSMQNRQSVLSDSTREKVGNGINENIKKLFTQKLTESEHKLINKFVMTNNSHYLNNVPNININKLRLFTDRTYRNRIESSIRDSIEDYILNIEKLQGHTSDAMKYIDWQTSGLADLLTLGKTKSNSNHSYILPNAKAIAGMNMFSSLIGSNVSLNIIEHKTLVDLLGALSSLKAMNNLSDKDIQAFKELYNRESKAIDHIWYEMNELTDLSADIVYHGSQLGFDGYLHSKNNPYKSYQIIKDNDKDSFNSLSRLGYKKSATLTNGYIVMATKHNLATNYTTGILGLTESSINGANISDLTRLGSNGVEDSLINQNTLKNVISEFKRVISNSSNYYENLIDYTNSQLIINNDGTPVKHIIDIDTKLKDQLTESTEYSYESIGNYYARLTEESVSSNLNEKFIDELNSHYHKDNNKGNYILITKETSKQSTYDNSKDGLTNSRKQYNKFVAEFYNTLPKATKDYIDSVGGLYVRRNEMDMIMGYRQASVTDLFTGKSGLPSSLQKALRGTIEAVAKLSGVNPVVFTKYIERLLQEVTSLSKDYILIRSVIVPVQNIISNVIHLWNLGIPVSEIPSLLTKGYKEAKQYTKTHSEVLAIRHKLRLGRLTIAEKTKLQAKLNTLNLILEKSTVAPLMREGILTSISDLSQDVVKEDDPFSILTNLSNKFGISTTKEHLPSFVRNTLMLKGSTTHNLLNEFLDYGDFIAKYAVYEYYTKKKGYESRAVINLIRDEFVNYAMNRGREFDWLNKTGLTWFLSYKLAIQKIIYRNLRRNTLRTLATLIGGNVARDAGFNLIQTVPQQRLWFDYSGYQFEADNIVDGFTSHWLSKLL